MLQMIQIVGALAILAAFALAQFGLLSQQSWWYLGLNLIGAAVLAVLAYLERQWGLPASRGRLGSRLGMGPDRTSSSFGTPAEQFNPPRVRTADDATPNRYAHNHNK
jgi:hypothetical protein